MKTRGWKGIIAFFALGFLMMALAGCAITTPELKGTVIDKETGKPVKAWVIATVTVTTVTMAGGIAPVYFVGRTWTDDTGKFTIPPKTLHLTSFYPIGHFGSFFKKLRMDANSSMGRHGGITFYTKEEAKHHGPPDIMINYLGDIEEYFRDGKLYLEYPKGESDYYGHLGSLYYYCKRGRYKAAWIKDECDIVDFLIEEHEYYLEKYSNPQTVDQKIYYCHTTASLADLYKKKRDYERALILFKKAKDFGVKNNLLYPALEKDIDMEIDELQQKLKGTSNQ